MTYTRFDSVESLQRLARGEFKGCFTGAEVARMALRIFGVYVEPGGDDVEWLERLAALQDLRS